MIKPKMKRTTPLPDGQILRSMQTIETKLDMESRHHVRLQKKLRRVVDQRKRTVALIQEAVVNPAMNLLRLPEPDAIDVEYEEDEDPVRFRRRPFDWGSK